MADSDRVVVPGSERPAVSDEQLGEVDPDEQSAVTLYLRPRGDAPVRRRVTREEFADHLGVLPADVEAITRFAEAHSLRVGDAHPGRRSVRLTGRLADLQVAFGVSLVRHRADDGQFYNARQGSVTVPVGIADMVTGVFGLDGRPQARAQLRVSTATRGYTPIAVGDAYGYPPRTDGAGQTVALIELGGGFRPTDLEAYFSSLGITIPTVTAVPVDGGANTPGTANGPDGEVMLDIEVVGALAPKATIVVYFAPNTDQGFLDAVTMAVHDTTHRPSVISISWGGAESAWTIQAMRQMEQAFADAAAFGVTVTVAAGDNGSTDGVTDGLQHVDFPASAPHALACGGTRLTLVGTEPTEVVWGGTAADGSTGGGVSAVFPVPAYQDAALVPPSANPGGKVGRGVPDVAGNADPQTGYAIRVDGEDIVVGGTSAVAPLWAALVVRLNQALGRDVGDIHAVLYGAPADLTDITQGTNGSYQARVGWDPCTGLGTPRGEQLLGSLRAVAP